MEVHAVVSRGASALWEVLFPVRCVVCAAEGEWWCAECRAAVEKVPRDPCPACASTQVSHVCEMSSDLSGLVVTGFYHDRALRCAIHGLKYRGARELLAVIRAHMSSWRAARSSPFPWVDAEHVAIQPLPTSPGRARERGYDQACLLATLVADTILPGAEAINVLRRHTNDIAQATVDSHELRQVNVRDSFYLLSHSAVPPVVLLVDDVVTSGSTMREAARVLKVGGAERVYGFALAVGA